MKYGNYPKHEEIKKILVVNLRHLGDVLLTSPLFIVLKKEMPHSQIDAYVYKESYPMLEGQPCLDNILTYDREIKKYPLLKRLTQEFKILKEIRKRKYDLVINLTEGDRGAIVAKASKAKYKVGYPIFSGMRGKKKIYTHFVKQSSSLRHKVEQYLDALRRIGLFPKEEDRDLFFQVPPKAYENIKKILVENNFDLQNFILIHPCSRWRFKCWPAFRMHNLVKKLIQKNQKIVFTAGKETFEKEMIKEITKDLPKEFFLDLSGKISLKELGALIDLSKLLICVDSLPLHIASALKAKCLVLFGPTSDKTWGPWKNKEATLLAKDYSCRPCFLDGCGGSKISDCLYTLLEEEVFEEIKKKITI